MITELAVVEALRISNSLGEAMEEPSLDMPEEKRAERNARTEPRLVESDTSLKIRVG